MTSLKLVKLKPLEFFEANAFKDHDGDYWKTKEYRDYFDKNHTELEDSYAVYPKNIEKGYMEIPEYVVQINKWAIERVLNIIDDPEYFLIK
jgi:hypothetical protein